MIEIRKMAVRLQGLPWWWVAVKDLARIIYPGKWRDYLALSKDVPDSLTVAVKRYDGDLIPYNYELVVAEIDISAKKVLVYDHAWKRMQSISDGWLLGHDHEGDITEDLFVPLGFAEDVARAFQLGAVRLETIFHDYLSVEDECPEGTLMCVFTGGGFTAVIGIDKNGNPITIPEEVF
ncbi:MAG: hypothetical protein WA103_01020 [Minisyncoccales bacterium]